MMTITIMVTMMMVVIMMMMMVVMMTRMTMMTTTMTTMMTIMMMTIITMTKTTMTKTTMTTTSTTLMKLVLVVVLLLLMITNNDIPTPFPRNLARGHKKKVKQTLAYLEMRSFAESEISSPKPSSGTAVVRTLSVTSFSGLFPSRSNGCAPHSILGTSHDKHKGNRGSSMGGKVGIKEKYSLDKRDKHKAKCESGMV